jgi:hypothetical protein
MKRFVLACALIAVAALAAGTRCDRALAQTDTVTFSAAKISLAQTSGRWTACTRSGCHPILRGCHIETEYDLWGNPTGYDKVVCPGRLAG